MMMKKTYETPYIISLDFVSSEMLQGLSKIGKGEGTQNATGPALIKENSNLPIVDMDSDDDW